MTTTITDLPTPPSRERPTTFSTESDEFLAALPVFVTETNTVAGEMNTIINDSETAKTGAEAAKTGAEAAESASELNATLAASFSNALPYNASTTYAKYASCIGTDYIIYYSKGDGNTGNDPVTDGGTYWQISVNTTDTYISFWKKFGGL